MDTIAAINANLYAKMEETFQDFANWLLKQPAEVILDHAYEYAIKENILLVLEYNDLEEAQVNGLLTAEDPLDFLYNEVGESATISLDALLSLIEDKADQLADSTESYADIQVYPYSVSRAEEDGDLDWYRQSHKLNIACKDAIEKAISRHYRNNSLNAKAIQDVVDQFGWAKTSFVLVNTIRNKTWDGRISQENKQWAQLAPMFPDVDSQGNNRRLRYVINSHPGLTDMFAKELRRQYQINQEHIEKPSVRNKLKNTDSRTSPKFSAKLKEHSR